MKTNQIVAVAVAVVIVVGLGFVAADIPIGGNNTTNTTDQNQSNVTADQNSTASTQNNASTDTNTATTTKTDTNVQPASESSNDNQWVDSQGKAIGRGDTQFSNGSSA